jgi:antitoxin ParD1/3/4
MPNVHLTDDLEEYVQGKLASGLYNSVSEVVREALREKIERERAEAVHARLTRLVLEGVDLGPPDGVSEEVWSAKRTAVLARVRRNLDGAFEEMERSEGVDGRTVVDRVKRRLDRQIDEDK